MTFKHYRDESRLDWGRELPDDRQIEASQIALGAQLRAADALEKMAQPWAQIHEDRDYWKQRAESAERALDTERRRAAALRGVINHAKANR